MNGLREEKSIYDIFLGWRRWVSFAFFFLIAGTLFMLSAWFRVVYFNGTEMVEGKASVAFLLRTIAVEKANLYDRDPTIGLVRTFFTGSVIAVAVLFVIAVVLFKKDDINIAWVGYLASAIIAVSTVATLIWMWDIIEMYFKSRHFSLGANAFIAIGSALAAVLLLITAQKKHREEQEAIARYEAGAKAVSKRYGRYNGQSVAAIRANDISE